MHYELLPCVFFVTLVFNVTTVTHLPTWRFDFFKCLKKYIYINFYMGNNHQVLARLHPPECPVSSRRRGPLLLPLNSV